MITKTQLYILNKLPEKVINKISITPTGCWIWSGQKNRNGYGRIYHKGSRRMIHKFVWLWLGRHIKEKYVLDHTCRNRACCNPTHLSDVTVRVNTHRGKARLFTK